ncbi:MAG: putative glycolipid-binding domain-containing protein [Actinomycetota bacterium]|nr:putative glycolipid-binding domain-containing protein [Actinomycetota bacterium]
MLWSGLDAWRVEAASLEFSPNSLAAMGTQLGTEPVPYRLDYNLQTGPGYITEILNVDVAGDRWDRGLRLRRHADGTWEYHAHAEGDAPLAPAGGEVAPLEGALDCDLALSPLTNLMPIRRHGLHERPGHADFLMAWVSVPDLGLHASQQRYEHVSRDVDHSVVRYIGRDPDFVGDLVLDRDGIVKLYPDLAQRLNAD